MTERLRQLIASTFDLPAREVPDDPVAGDPGAWDSAGHLELMMAVEMDYGVRIPAERMAELVSAERIESFLRSCGAWEAA